MKGSSMGPRGRVGEFTLDEHKGIINTHEEIFLLGAGRGVIERPNQLTYMFGDRKWAGKAAMLQALRDDADLRDAIVKELRRRDLEGMFGNGPDVEEAATPEPVAVPAIIS